MPYKSLPKGWISLSPLAILLVPVLASAGQPPAGMSDEELWRHADARIEKYRKADATILVVDSAGKPVPAAQLAVEQTRHAFLFGCNIFLWGRVGDEKAEAEYRRRFAELLNYATLPFYWPTYERRPGEPDHAHTEQVARWCQQHGILTKGHPLAWNFADPAWLPDDLETIRRLQMARIEDCVGRFAGLIDRWDVVNEATHFDRDQFLRRAPKMSALWKKLGQINFTRECFEHARKAGPNAILLINDYRTDPAYERLLEQLVDSGGKRLYDAIGIQSHMHGGVWPNRQIWEVCERFARFGVPLHFTETTILSARPGRPRPVPWVTTPEGEAFQAREVVRFYTMLFSHPAVEAITWWDFTDRRAWQGAPAGFLRADMSPKPAYEELLKLVKGKWWTKSSANAGSDGVVQFRGFLGEYRLRATLPDGKTAETRFTLSRQGPNRATIRVGSD
ncbi:MAG: endo-1,4-beta-xylanase [Thermoguttaceae bacterium]